jgi:predicted TIM-barrel fold metal-dependent hydrolase
MPKGGCPIRGGIFSTASNVRRRRTSIGVMRHTVAVFILLSACAHQPPARMMAPLVDHHQHLLSPTGGKLMNAALPAIELPPDIARLIELRQARWNDGTALAELYVEDSVVLARDAPGWIRGREKVAAYLSTLFSRPFRITPVMWRDGQLAGYLTRGEDWHFGYIHLRVVDGRIATEIPTFPGPSRWAPFGAAELVKSLDAAGIGRAVILSNALFFNSAGEVRAENDWTAAEAAKFPGRLVAFCSFNPMADYALSELDHCAAGSFRGVKLHFHESGVDLLDPGHVAKVRRVFEAANRHRLPLLVHIARGADPPYGARHAQVFAGQLAAAAPDVPVVVAHLWGGGPASEEALAVYAKQPNLWFETSGAVNVGASREELAKIAARMREIGLKRFLFGSDGPDYLDAGELGNVWPQMHQRLPLTEEELAVIGSNVAPFLR